MVSRILHCHARIGGGAGADPGADTFCRGPPIDNRGPGAAKAVGQASKQVGVSKPTLSKAISTGKLSATRREDGSWAIDPAELCCYVEANGHRLHSATGNGSRVETQDDTAIAAAIEAQVEALRQVEILLRQELIDV